MRKVIFLYLGRRGFSQFAIELAAAAKAHPLLDWWLYLSSSNHDLSAFCDMEKFIVPVKTFDIAIESIIRLDRLILLRRKLVDFAVKNQVEAVINLMPHIWSPFIGRGIKSAGIKYFSIIHDAAPHPGDPSGFIHRLLTRDAKIADRVFTLSAGVARKATQLGIVNSDNVIPLFHPHLNKRSDFRPLEFDIDEPLRLLSFGRLLPYKGLVELLDALEIVQRAGFQVSLSIMGEGNLEKLALRLSQLEVSVVNRWMTMDEISLALASHHAVVLSHSEASQSGVAAMSLGFGTPVIALPTGGLVEQISNGINGILASGTSATDLANAIILLKTTIGLHSKLIRNAAIENERNSMQRFLHRILEF